MISNQNEIGNLNWFKLQNVKHYETYFQNMFTFGFYNLTFYQKYISKLLEIKLWLLSMKK